MIHCIGDSHSAVFSGEEAMQPCWPEPAANKLPYFKSYRIGPATAYQIQNKQLIIESLLDSINFTSEDNIMFCFGEVDIRAHLIKQSKLQDNPVNDLVIECVNRYINALTYYKKYKVPIIVWGPIASWSEEKQYTGGPSYGTNQERNWITFAFNIALQFACLKEGFQFASIFYQMVNDDMTTISNFLDDWEGSHMHLSQRSIPTILKQFKKLGLIL
jgi:hypothetical protein